jgi:hypothetical protein
MSDFDDILESEVDADGADGTVFDMEKWKAGKRAEREAVYDMLDKTAEKIADSSEGLKSYLDVQARFLSYSAGNAMLILAQRQDATKVGDFNYWKSQDARIGRAEKGISILEPAGSYTRDDGSSAKSYRVKKVFDISQTSLRKLPAIPAPENHLLLKALVHSSPVRIELADNVPGGARYDAKGNFIAVQREMEPMDIFRSLSTEICRARDSGNGIAEAPLCAAYVICRHNGIESGASFLEGVPDKFATLGAAEIREELSEIRRAASEVSEKMAEVVAPEIGAPQQARSR